MKSWRNASCKWWPSWWPKKIGGSAMENTFQQYEKLWKGTRKIKLAVLQKEQFFLETSRYTRGACLWWKWCVKLGLYWIEMRKSKSFTSQNISNERRLRTIHHSCSKQAFTVCEMNLMALISLLCFQFSRLCELAWCCVCCKCSWYKQD